MSLIRWSPAPLSFSHELASLHEDMDHLMGSLLPRNGSRSAAAGFIPPVDVEETAEEYVLRADLPGLSIQDVKVVVTGDVVTLRGERKSTRTDERGSLHSTERIAGAFERSFRLGAPVQADKVKATYREGVLEIRVPKAEEARQREIEVEVA